MSVMACESREVKVAPGGCVEHRNRKTQAMHLDVSDFVEYMRKTPKFKSLGQVATEVLAVSAKAFQEPCNSMGQEMKNKASRSPRP